MAPNLKSLNLMKMFHINDNSPLLSLRFPQKLWKIVNECQTGAIKWNDEGNAIILDYNKFQYEFLINKQGIFKTTNLTSFIRQLNLYGFKKVNGHCRENSMDLRNRIHEFHNDYFIRGRSDLLNSVSRKTGKLYKSNQTSVKTERQPEIPSKIDFTDSNTCRIKACQDALTEALKQAVLKKELYETCQQAEDQTTNKTDNPESLLERYIKCNETVTPDLLNSEFSLTWDQLLWNGENESSASNCEDMSSYAAADHTLLNYNEEFKTIKSEEIGISKPLKTVEKTFSLDKTRQSVGTKRAKKRVSKDTNSSTNGNRNVTNNETDSCGGQKMTLQKGNTATDIQVAWEDVMENVDNAFAEKMYDMFMSFEEEDNSNASSIALQSTPSTLTTEFWPEESVSAIVDTGHQDVAESYSSFSRKCSNDNTSYYSHDVDNAEYSFCFDPYSIICDNNIDPSTIVKNENF